MPLDANTAVTLAEAGSTGTGVKSAAGFSKFKRIMIEVEVEAIGASPTMTYTVQTSADGDTFSDTGYVTEDSTVAAVKTAKVVTTVSTTRLFIDGLDKRAAEHVAVTISANTNVTYSVRAYPID